MHFGEVFAFITPSPWPRRLSQPHTTKDSHSKPHAAPRAALTPLAGCEVQPSSAWDSFESIRTTAERNTG